MDDFAEKISNKFANFRCDMYAQVIKTYIKEIEKKSSLSPMCVQINRGNNLYFIPDKEKLSVIYGINFEDKTDINLAKLFFRELEDAKFGMGGTTDVKFHFQNIPDDIIAIEPKYKDFNCGFVSFSKC